MEGIAVLVALVLVVGGTIYLLSRKPKRHKTTKAPNGWTVTKRVNHDGGPDGAA